MARKQEEKILSLLRSGEKRVKDLVALSDMSERSTKRWLKKLRNKGKIKRRPGEGREVWYYIPKWEGRPKPPVRKAPHDLVNECLDDLESSLIKEKGEVKRQIEEKAQEKDEHAKRVLWIIERYKNSWETITDLRIFLNEIKEKPREPGFWDKPDIIELARRELQSSAVKKFSDLCNQYKKIIYNDEIRRRFFELLDRQNDFYPGDFDVLLSTLKILTGGAMKGNEDPRIVLGARKRIGLLEDLCLREEDFTLSSGTLRTIRELDEDRAREIFVKMVVDEKYPMELLVDWALTYYRDELGDLIEELKKLKKPSSKAKERAREFRNMLEKTVSG
ncbi:hypothetical protein AKJ58_01390 [candidate division MSBL1 archaeon SCGC-AAA385D11]|uniref:Uncharacterized protein n=1 Tax=candidate division MSBL1 archaeon SCGC-AAA385D11 TaxID=1698286 RepID=A0A133VNC7_9EURY|nr:hypothetical protein AKJ58_01390 [candidate division MSBL1 archaeon SCGC-AAA385D11]